MADNNLADVKKDEKWDLNLAARDLVPTYVNHFSVFTMSGNMRINMGETLFSGGNAEPQSAPRLSIIVNLERAVEMAEIVLKSYSRLNPANQTVAAAVKALAQIRAE